MIYVSGTMDHWWDAKFETVPSHKVYSITDIIPIFNFTSIGPFNSLAEAKYWLYDQRISWIVTKTARVYPDGGKMERDQKILGMTKLKKAFSKLVEDHPELLL